MWIEGVRRKRGKVEFLVIDRTGARRTGRDLVAYARDAATSDERETHRFEDLDLRSFAEVFPSEFVHLAGHSSRAELNQSVFECFAPGGRVLIPAALLITTLVGPHLFQSTAGRFRLAPFNTVPVDLIACVLDSPQSSPASLEHARLTPALVERFSWLTMYPSAREMWTSIGVAAERGQVSLRLPDAKIYGSVSGPVVQGTLLAKRLYVAVIQPGDPSLPPDRGRYFTRFYPTVQVRKQREQLLSSLLGTEVTPWTMTDAHWEQLRKSHEVAHAHPSDFLLYLDQGFKVSELDWERLSGSISRLREHGTGRTSVSSLLG
jgi:hypothetical protein